MPTGHQFEVREGVKKLLTLYMEFSTEPSLSREGVNKIINYLVGIFHGREAGGTPYPSKYLIFPKKNMNPTNCSKWSET